MQYLNKLQRRKLKALEQDVEDLQKDAEALAFLREAGHLFDAVLFYSHQPHITAKDREEIRQVLQILSYGGGN